MVLDHEQLETLKRQIEEEYQLDMAAIERLQRRFINPSGSNGRSLSPAAGATSQASFLAPVPDSQSGASSGLDLPQERHPDELTGTLRAMFSSGRR